MTQIQFYHLTSTPFERAAPKLVEKAYGAGYRVNLLAENQEKVDWLDGILWTFAQAAFLPHGTAKDDYPELQPVFISTHEDAPNNPDLLFITHGKTAKHPENYKRVLDIFDGNDEESVADARKRWKKYKDDGHEISYFSQKPDGGWEKKA